MELPLTPDTLSKDKAETVAAEMGLTLPHQEQWDFLQSLHTMDLQAAPGSGKTSLVGLKLALLAQGWTSATQGVCVLSHTNTAKDEIKQRITTATAGRRFLGYPHFIGTIQSFTHTFLAAPASRAQGGRIVVVDDAAYAAAAQRTLMKGWDYANLRSTLKHQQDAERLLSDAQFVCDGGDLNVISYRRLPFRPESKSGGEFTALKRRLAWAGIFRFQDMYAIAERHLIRAPHLARAISSRFPFVLLDEMQDTDALQQRLLDKVFGSGGTVMQRVGDVNQRIFSGRPKDDIGAAAFPSPMATELPVSRRFGGRIAELASELTVHRRQKIIGAGLDGTVALLLFDEQSVPEVVPAFERLAAEMVPEGLLSTSPPRVLGARKRPGEAQRFPQSVACYVPEFDAAEKTSGTHGSLADLVWAARTRWAPGTSREAATDLWDGIRAMARPYLPDQATPLPPLIKLDRSPATAGGRTRAILLDFLTGPVEKAGTWEAFCARLAVAIRDLTGAVAWDLRDTSAPLEPAARPAAPSARPGTSMAGTIQRAKGETHAATLILDCLGRTGQKYDVGQALAFLAGQGELARASETVKQAMQLVFVAATRPTHLLAFATLKEHATPHVAALEGRGWLIRDISPPR
ncbi:UvrD-helicase domain-containing protein [Streptomyces sp. NBC_01264]|uniref:UvrD-helicase domain-containing protein n=1 Tax=Streptomyces sp. NBC_01264 TaxID=2903804 RepID=UPI00224EBCB9|nr:UvrD-helicase domain-containing protein [Streptomyces sp. NBC_01264]MCX4776260.1 UvrD-helicase domain-containing protein [Streptomyces sp. NBC_01264]